MLDSNTPITIEYKPQILEYEGFKYKVKDGQWIIMFDNAPIIGFTNEAAMQEFITKVNDTVELSPPVKQLRLHLTGCMRCKRTSLGVETNPCKTGIPHFLNSKQIAYNILKHYVDMLNEPDKEPTEADLAQDSV